MSVLNPAFTAQSIFDVQKVQLDDFLELLSHCGEVVSVFIKPRPPVLVHGDLAQWMQEFLRRFAPIAQQSVMGPLDLQDIQFARLNRYELEGSLIALAHDGGCHGLNRHVPLPEVRKQVGDMLDAVFPAPFTQLWVWRFDRMDWCPWMRAATDCAGYLVWQPERDLWWLLCVCDEV